MIQNWYEVAGQNQLLEMEFSKPRRAPRFHQHVTPMHAPNVLRHPKNLGSRVKKQPIQSIPFYFHHLSPPVQKIRALLSVGSLKKTHYETLIGFCPASRVVIPLIFPKVNSEPQSSPTESSGFPPLDTTWTPPYRIPEIVAKLRPGTWIIDTMKRWLKNMGFKATCRMGSQWM